MIFITLLFTHVVQAATISPTPFPVFLKEGYSTILEFEEAPSEVVLGDSKAFQIERLNRSIVLKPTVPYANTNMFVYFKTKRTRLFVLSASEDAEPTYYRKFESLTSKLKKTATSSKKQTILSTKTQVLKVSLDKKKDYLTIDVQIGSDGSERIAPKWNLVRAKFKSQVVAPAKLWSERQEVLRDSTVKARFIFAKPNLPANLKGVSLVLPLKGSSQPLVFELGGSRS